MRLNLTDPLNCIGIRCSERFNLITVGMVDDNLLWCANMNTKKYLQFYLKCL